MGARFSLLQDILRSHKSNPPFLESVLPLLPARCRHGSKIAPKWPPNGGPNSSEIVAKSSRSHRGGALAPFDLKKCSWRGSGPQNPPKRNPQTTKCAEGAHNIICFWSMDFTPYCVGRARHTNLRLVDFLATGILFHDRYTFHDKYTFSRQAFCHDGLLFHDRYTLSRRVSFLQQITVSLELYCFHDRYTFS